MSNATDTAVTVVEKTSDLAPHCPVCDYNLRGNTTGSCPECGWAIVEDDVVWTTVSETETLPLLRRTIEGNWLTALLHAAFLAYFMPWRLGRLIPPVVAAKRMFRIGLCWKAAALVTTLVAVAVVSRRTSPVGDCAAVLVLAIPVGAALLLFEYLFAKMMTTTVKAQEAAEARVSARQAPPTAYAVYLCGCFLVVIAPLASAAFISQGQVDGAIAVGAAAWWLMSLIVTHCSFTRDATDVVLILVSVVIAGPAALIVGVLAAVVFSFLIYMAAHLLGIA